MTIPYTPYHTLQVFQESLASISGEIQTLQDQSQSMSVKLKNRKDVHGRMSAYLDVCMYVCMYLCM